MRRGRRSVPQSLAMSWRCRLCNPPRAVRIGRGTGNFQRPEQVVIRRFRNVTGKEQADENRARHRARSGCTARPGFSSPTAEACPCERSDESALRRSCENHLVLVHRFLGSFPLAALTSRVRNVGVPSAGYDSNSGNASPRRASADPGLQPRDACFAEDQKPACDNIDSRRLALALPLRGFPLPGEKVGAGLALAPAADPP